MWTRQKNIWVKSGEHFAVRYYYNTNAISECYSNIAYASFRAGFHKKANENYANALIQKKRIFNEYSIEFLYLYYQLIAYYSTIGNYKNELEYRKYNKIK